MKVEILKHPTEDDWMLCKRCTLVTVSKDSSKPPTEEWKRRILKSNHSPIRTLQFCFRLTDIPYWVSVHLVRHVHATPFVSSQRNDRQDKYDRTTASQDSPVTMCWYMNAEELITIAHKRLCNLASKETREVVRKICDKVVEANPQSIIDYKAGKDRAIGFLVGQIMKETKGKANPQIVNKLLLEIINK